MPIIGITSRVADNATLPRLGKIRKGAPKTEKRPGADLDHFRITLQPEYSQFEDTLKTLYGETPVELSGVRLLGSTPDEAFESWMIERTASTLAHRCDGEVQDTYWDKASGQYKHGAACVRASGQTPACACSMRGYLRVVLPAFIEVTGVWGYFQLETGAYHDIKKLYEHLCFHHRLLGSLNGVVWHIGRAPQPVSVPDEKSKSGRSMQTKNLLYIMPDPKLAKVLLQAYNAPTHALMQGVNAATGELPPTPTLPVSPSTALPAPMFHEDETVIEFLDDEEHAAGDDLGFDLNGDAIDEFMAGYEDSDTVPPTVEKWNKEATFLSVESMFKAREHFENLMAQLLRENKVKPEMNTLQVVAVIKANRDTRETDKWTSGEWVRDAELVKMFCANTETSLKFQPADVLAAINWLSGSQKPFTKFSQIKGVSKIQAWAACVLKSRDYDYEKARAWVKPDSEIGLAISAIEVDRMGEVPA